MSNADRPTVPFHLIFTSHSLQAFSDALRAEVAADGVRVSNISPGYVDTNISRNAVAADGSNWGRSDANNAGGYDADEVAGVIADAIRLGEKDLVIAQPLPKVAIFLRRFWPGLYFWFMTQRAGRTRPNLKSD